MLGNTKHLSILVRLAMCLEISTATLCKWPYWFDLPTISGSAHCIPHWSINYLYPTWPLIWHWSAYWTLGAIHLLLYLLDFIPKAQNHSTNTATLQDFLFWKLKAISKTCIIGTDTSLTISSLFTHSHYFCLVEQWSNFSPAGGDTVHDLPLRHHILTSRELIWQHITTTAELTNNLAKYKILFCYSEWSQACPLSLLGYCCHRFRQGVNITFQATECDLQQLLFSC